MPASASRFNPFPGLRPFELRDRPVFFGREVQTAELLDRLQTSRLLAVVRTSEAGNPRLCARTAARFARRADGSCRSELADRGNATRRRSVGSLATALLETGRFTAAADPHDLLRATLNRSALGLIEAVPQSQLPPGYNLLLVVDQFEEIFRFRDRHARCRKEAGGYVQLLSRPPVRPAFRSTWCSLCARISSVTAPSSTVSRERSTAASAGPPHET
jgi:hypothetical protein